MTDLIPVEEEPYELPPGSRAGRILVEVLGAGDTGVYRWETEVLDYDGDSAVFWITEGVGFDFFFNDVDFEGPGHWVVEGITVTWTRGDGWETDDDEDWEWTGIRAAIDNEIKTGALA